MPQSGIISIMMKPPPARASPGRDRRISQQQLQKLRNQHGGAIKHETQNKHEENSRRQIAILQQLQLDNRVRMPPFPENPADENDHRHDRLRSTIQFDPNQSSSWPLSSTICRRADRQSDQPKADVIDA